jgi:N-acetylneuraminate synthase/N,N'-diacetyllegionaminate synthase
MKAVKICNKPIGAGAPCFVVAEVGVNHNGSVGLAKQLIDCVVSTGADAVKFQAFKTDQTISVGTEKAAYQKKTTGVAESQYEMVKQLELTEENLAELSQYAQHKGLIFLSSVFDEESVNQLHRLDVAAYKVGSGEITNVPLLCQIARQNKPIILSTGMASLGEVERALNELKKAGANDIVLLHCVSEYPASVEDLNLKTIQTLQHAFKVLVGFSDHTIDINIAAVAVALGACVIEKHITVSRSLSGPDHLASLEPAEFKEMVQIIRSTEQALGNGIKQPTAKEHELRKVARKSLTAKVDIPAHAYLTEEMLAIKRPGIGISPQYLDMIIGAETTAEIKKGQVLMWKMLRA